MSASFLSQLERGLTGASSSALIRIANCYGISISELFCEAERSADPVVRRATRPSLPMMNGQRKTLLSRRPLTHFEVYIGEFEPGGSSGAAPYTHGDSLEMVLVLRGIVRLDLGPESHVLEEGDCTEYATSVPHRIENIGDTQAEVLFVISPPTSAAVHLDEFRSLRTAGGRDWE